MNKLNLVEFKPKFPYNGPGYTIKPYQRDTEDTYITWSQIELKAKPEIEIFDKITKSISYIGPILLIDHSLI